MPGDGLLTYDDVNHREWLDLTVSALSQFGGSVTDRIQRARAELQPGGLFEGFTGANSLDIAALRNLMKLTSRPCRLVPTPRQRSI